MTDIAEYMRQGGPCVEHGQKCRVMDAASGCACASAAAEIERLRAELQNLGQVGQLSEELERLRAALALFACDCTVSERCVVPDACRNFKARRMLEERT